MNQKIIIGVVAVVLLAGGAYYFKSRSTPTPSSNTQTVGQTVKESKEWANAIKSGKPTSCVMVRGEDKMEYYVEGKKMRADITTTIEAKTHLSHMINDSSYLYMWTDGETQGTKMNLLIPSPSPVDSTPSQYNKPQSPNFEDESGYDNLKNEGYTVNCQGVSANSSLLVPPSTVTFIDPTEVMKKITPTEGNSGVDIQKLQEMAKQYQGQ